MYLELFKNGGAYLGICARAYYAATSIEFDKEPKEVRIFGEFGAKFYTIELLRHTRKQTDLMNR